VNWWHSVCQFLPFAWTQFAFMRQALLAILLLCPLLALLGCMVISNNMAFYSDAVGHAALAGVAIGVLLGMRDPLLGMLAFAMLLALAVTSMRRYSAVSMDTVIGVTMAFSVALGIVLLSRGGSFAAYSHYLVGDVLTVGQSEIKRLALLTLIVLGLWMMFFNRLLLLSLSRSLASSRGLRVWLLETLFAILVAAVVTAAIPWVGLLVVNSLLVVPAATARNLARNTVGYYSLAVGVSLASGIAGLVLSFYWGTATGATIVLCAASCFALSLAWRRKAGCSYPI